MFTIKLTGLTSFQVAAAEDAGATVTKSTATWTTEDPAAVLDDIRRLTVEAKEAQRRWGIENGVRTTASAPHWDRLAAKFAAAVEALPPAEEPATVADATETDEEPTVAAKPAPKKAAAPTAAQRKAASGSAIVAALETAYSDVRRVHKDLPEVVFITGTGLMGRGAKWGHYWRDRWVDAPVAGAEQAETEASAGGSFSMTPGRRPEVFIAGERLACGAEDTFETILHESAHALAVVRGLQDTSKEGRYHNKTFLALAEELGLEFAGEAPHPQIGYSNTRLREETKERYAKTIAKLQAAITTYLDTFKGLTLGTSGAGAQGGDAPLPVPPKGGKSKSRNYAKAVCGCGRTIRIAPKVLAEAPITCGSCGDPFEATGD